VAELSPQAALAVSEARAGRGARLAPPVKAELSAPAPAAPPAAAPSPAAAPINFSMPDLSNFSVPGETLLEKAFIVLALLILGIGLYSRVTGKPMLLSLNGLTNQARGAAPAQTYYAQQDRRIALATDTMFTRMNLANPARIS
jgi:hypothetical protein